MGRQRNSEEHIFVKDPEGSNRVKCIICSNLLRKNLLLCKSSVSSHRRTQVHLNAIEKNEAGAAMNNVLIPSSSTSVIDHTPAIISEADMLLREAEMSELDHGQDSANGVSWQTELERNIREEISDPCFLFTTDSVLEVEDEREDITTTLEEEGIEDETGDIDEALENNTEEDPHWYPYGSKTMFYLDLLDNLPRLRLSDDQLKVIMWVMKKCGTLQVPSFQALRKKQKELTLGILPTKRHVSALGNEFYMNHPVDLLKLDWANPLVRKHIRLYPEITTVVSESWQADKWVKEVSENQLTPMWANWKDSPHRHFYVREVALLKTGNFALPIRWMIFNGQEHFQSYKLAFNGTQTFTVEDATIMLVPCSELVENYLELKSRLGDISLYDRHELVSMPHHVRGIAKGRPAFCIRIMPWVDDVSGNRSKQYNAHMNIYLANISIPHQKLKEEYFVRFCSTSPHASAPEQLDALAQDLRSDTWQEAYDCFLNDDIIFKVFGHIWAADNPQQAELASTSGSMSQYWCRSDMSGGSRVERQSDTGHEALYEVATARKVEDTVTTIHNILLLACKGVKKPVSKLQTMTGVKDKTATFWVEQVILKARQLRTDRIKSTSTRDPRLVQRNLSKVEQAQVKRDIKAEIQSTLFQWIISQPEERYCLLPPDSPLRLQLQPGDHYNVLLGIEGVNPHADTPCEILHTILLGIDKYLWYETSNNWKKSEEGVFARRLASSSLDGLSITSLRARYMLKYKNSLVGRHFRALQQLSIFHLTADLFPEPKSDKDSKFQQIMALWRATGELAALLWFPEIHNMDQYVDDVNVCVNNLLDCWGEYDPSRLTYKYKLHVLLHLERDIRRFGPPILYATEVFECWNSVFRLCSVLSNHQAPSKDIAMTLADMERFKHIVSGGWWKSGEQHVQAGGSVRDVMIEDKALRRRLGLNTSSPSVAGKTTPVPRSNRTRFSLSDIAKEDMQISADVTIGEDTMWQDCRQVITRSLDHCKPGSWVCYKYHGQPSALTSSVIRIGQISRIVESDSGHQRGLVFLKAFTLASEKDSQLNMPILTDDNTTQVISSESLQFDINVQHVTREVKKAKSSPRTPPTIITFFVINMHALHNAHLIRHTLPRHITAPVPIFRDRRQKHLDFATAVRSNRNPTTCPKD